MTDQEMHSMLVLFHQDIRQWIESGFEDTFRTDLEFRRRLGDDVGLCTNLVRWASRLAPGSTLAQDLAWMLEQEFVAAGLNARYPFNTEDVEDRDLAFYAYADEVESRTIYANQKRLGWIYSYAMLGDMETHVKVFESVTGKKRWPFPCAY